MKIDLDKLLEQEPAFKEYVLDFLLKNLLTTEPKLIMSLYAMWQNDVTVDQFIKTIKTMGEFE